MLWLALELPRLSLEVFRRGIDAAAPTAISTGGNRPAVLLADAAAAHAGIRPDMLLSAAYALLPGLNVLPRDPILELQALEGLALWGEQFTPTLCLAAPAALLLEISGSLKLFGGLGALTHLVRTGLEELGFAANLTCAPTPAGALMLARNELDTFITELEAMRTRLAQLPVEGLDTDPATVAALARLGLRSVGEVLRLPRDGLARRFGRALVDHLDQAFGHRPDPRAPFVPPPRFSSRLVLPAPVPEMEQLLFGLKRLTLEFAGFLAARQAGVTRFTVALEHEDHPPTRVRMELSMPSRDSAHLILLLRERLSRITLPQPVEAFALVAEETMQLVPGNFSFFSERGHAVEDRAALVERLRARLGREAVHGLILVPEHRPELAWRESEPGTPQASPPSAPRPLWLLEAARALLMDDRGPRLDGPLRIGSGPERIESGWWDDGDVRRDYFVATNPEGARFWVYREHATRGDESGKTAGVTWFLHGVFA
ncbi:MAG: DNA polymerase Y family protein [Betaproteobacteria bacterium]